MFKNLTEQELKQNKGHIFQLSERAKNFNKCFNNIELNIDIKYKNNFPIILDINYLKNNFLFKKEIFMKTTYIDDYDPSINHDKNLLNRYNMALDLLLA